MTQLNVQDYGAAGDGASDDTAAIQSALDDATDGDTVYFPEGEYFVTTDSSGGGAILSVPTTVDNLTIRGERGYNSVRVFVEQAEYDDDNNFAVFRIPVDDAVVTGLEIRDLTIDGNRPSDVSRFQPSSDAIQFWPSGAGGGHDVLVEDCWLENTNAAGILVRESGVRINRVTAVDNNGQNFGLSERDDSTAGTSDYGIVLTNSVSKGAGGSGVDHNQGGRIRVAGLYSTGNRSGLKTTKDNRQTRIENATFEAEHSLSAIRTNISTTADIPDPPVELSLDTVAVRNSEAAGLYLSGDDSSIQNSAVLDGPIEIRNCDGDASGSGGEGGITVHSAGGGNVTEIRVVGTTEGPGVFFSADHDLTIDTYYHADNEGGAVGEWKPGGDLTIGTQRNSDPGKLDTPAESEVGAWSSDATDDGSGTDTSGVPVQTTGGSLSSTGGVLDTR